MRQEIIKILPIRLRTSVEQSIGQYADIEEIRIRVGQPLEIRCQSKSIWISQTITAEEIEEMLTFISQYSIYAYEEDIRQGFLTLEGGNRIGFAGQVRLEEGKVVRMTNIRFLNIRIAQERKGCAKELLPWLYDGEEVCNTLLISKPGIGKTTFLRDCVRMVSNGEGQHKGKKVCVIDERSEIAACHLGIPQNDIGKRTDVMDGCPKKEGMLMALRSMSPEVVVVDELGGDEDAAMVEQMLLCGCRILGTMHGDNLEQLIQNKGMEPLYQKRLFQRYIILKKQENGERIFHIYDQERKQLC